MYIHIKQFEWMIGVSKGFVLTTRVILVHILNIIKKLL